MQISRETVRHPLVLHALKFQQHKWKIAIAHVRTRECLCDGTIAISGAAVEVNLISGNEEYASLSLSAEADKRETAPSSLSQESNCVLCTRF